MDSQNVVTVLATLWQAMICTITSYYIISFVYFMLNKYKTNNMNTCFKSLCNKLSYHTKKSFLKNYGLATFWR